MIRGGPLKFNLRTRLLRSEVQAKAVAQHAPPSASAIPGDDALAQVMQTICPDATNGAGQRSQ